MYKKLLKPRIKNFWLMYNRLLEPRTRRFETTWGKGVTFRKSRWCDSAWFGIGRRRKIRYDRLKDQQPPEPENECVVSKEYNKSKSKIWFRNYYETFQKKKVKNTLKHL